MRVGWAKADFKPGYQLGQDDCSWAFDGWRVRIFTLKPTVNRTSPPLFPIHFICFLASYFSYHTGTIAS